MSPHHREKVVDGTFRSASSGHELFTRAWLPRGDASPPRALLLLAHGIHEHVGRFDALATALARAKVAVYGWDHVGHGRSGGELRHQFGRDGFDGVVDDAVQYARLVRGEYPREIPMAFAGASFGGLVAAHAVLRSPDLSWSSLTLIAPAIDVRWNLTLRAQALAGAALARAAPDRRLIPAVPPERLSDDKDAVEEYARDPLVTVANVRAKAGYEILKGFESLRKRYGEITTPLLVLHGAEDEATDPGASEIFVREAGSTDKTFASLPNAGHLIAHERATRDVVTRAIVDFVVSRAAAAAATTTPGASEREEDARGSAGASRRGGGGGGEERESVAPAVVVASRL